MRTLQKNISVKREKMDFVWLRDHGYLDLPEDQIKEEVFQDMSDCFGCRKDSKPETCEKVCGDTGVVILYDDEKEEPYRRECLCRMFTL